MIIDYKGSRVRAEKRHDFSVFYTTAQWRAILLLLPKHPVLTMKHLTRLFNIGLPVIFQQNLFDRWGLLSTSSHTTVTRT